jgi:hypothetical protein
MDNGELLTKVTIRVNVTVVFKAGFARWAGLFLCLDLCLAWWLAARDNLFGGRGEGSLSAAEDCNA